LIARGTRTIKSNLPVAAWAMGRVPSLPYDLPSANRQRVPFAVPSPCRTMYMTPTSTKALMPTESANIPKRRSEGHKVIIYGKRGLSMVSLRMQVAIWNLGYMVP
jgi:hypothetical protein